MLGTFFGQNISHLGASSWFVSMYFMYLFHLGVNVLHVLTCKVPLVFDLDVN